MGDAKQIEERVTKDMIESYLHRCVAWHEFAPKGEYIAGGTFKKNRAIFFVEEKESPYTMYAKCDGVSELTPLSAWREKPICARCRLRAGAICKTVASPSLKDEYNQRNINMICPDGAPDAYLTKNVLVPSGCPHEVVNAGSQGSIVSYIKCVEKSKVRYPAAWRLTRDSDKIDLCLRYEDVVFAVNGKKPAKKSYYCHIVTNLANGSTYVSDLHADSNRIKYEKSSKQALETLTYSGVSELLSLLPSINEDEIRVAFRSLRDAVADALREKYGEGVASQDVLATSLADFFIDDDNDVADSNGSPEPYGFSTHELLWQTAIANRYPFLADYPLTLRKLFPTYLVRRFDKKIPRDAKPDEVGKALGLPSSPILDDAYIKMSHAVEIVAAFCEMGIDDVLLLEEIVSDKTSMRKIYEEFKHCEPCIYQAAPCGYDTFDMFSLVMPQYIANMRDDEDIADVVYFVKNMLFSRSNRSIALVYDLLASDGQDMNAFFSDYVTNSLHETAKLRKMKLAPSLRNPTFIILYGMAPRVTAYFEDFRDYDQRPFSATVSGKMYLDRRAWTKKIAKEYFAFLKKQRKFDAKRRFDYRMNNSNMKREDSRTKIKEKLSKLDAFECSLNVLSAMKSALRFNLYVSEYSTNTKTDRERVSEETLFIYEWAEKNRIDIPLKFDQSTFMQEGKNARKKLADRKRQRDRRKKVKKNNA